MLVHSNVEHCFFRIITSINVLSMFGDIAKFHISAHMNIRMLHSTAGRIIPTPPRFCTQMLHPESCGINIDAISIYESYDMSKTVICPHSACCTPPNYLAEQVAHHAAFMEIDSPTH
ncbi:hypothetical protein PAHAL_1G079800 [Panicum hallii]|jgi:hypothetical protein|uniref:Uncharacterized protein n=1 Tax=Panicum hallii TaxID=206008 RepID=A0A2T8KUE7_9POAL|nr:hypothetical protein PAHAL_1G079800 [Panicum hallii]